MMNNYKPNTSFVKQVNYKKTFDINDFIGGFSDEYIYYDFTVFDNTGKYIYQISIEVTHHRNTFVRISRSLRFDCGEVEVPELTSTGQSIKADSDEFNMFIGLGLALNRALIPFSELECRIISNEICKVVFDMKGKK